MLPDNGIYQAIVTDTSKFFSSGKITVRIQSWYNGEFKWDLSKDFDKSKYFKEIMQDVEAYVFTPIGGGSGHGLMAIPQVNSTGVVQFIDGNIRKPIWMGSFFKPERDQDKKLLKVNIPNDKPEAEGPGSDGIIGVNGRGEKKIKGGFGTVVLRTKTTNNLTEEDAQPEKMDFEKNRTENLVVLDKEELGIYHFVDWDEREEQPKRKRWQELLLSKGEILDSTGDVIRDFPLLQLRNNDIDDNGQRSLGVRINDTEATLETTNTETNIKSTISSNFNGADITVSDTKKENSTQIMVRPETIMLINKKVSILIENNEISISAPDGKIRLSGEQVLLGDGGGYVVIRDNPGQSRLEDGTVLKTSSKARA